MQRRTFLAGLTAAFSSALLHPRHARAGAPAARRLVVFFSPNGTVHRHWRPIIEGAAFRFAQGSILEPLTSIKEKLVLVDGLDFVGASNHEGGMAAMLTGGGGASTESRGRSVDQYVADAIGGQTRFRSLELGVATSAWGGSVQTRMSYRGPDERVPPDDDPRRVFRRLFGEVAGGSTSPLTDKRRSVLDLVRAEVADLRGRVPPVERAKLDLHLEALRQVESGISMDLPPPELCAPPLATEIDPRANDAFPMVGRAQTDLLVAALACGMTNVGSIQWSHTVSPVVFSWLGHGEAHHALSHVDDGNPAGLAQFVEAERWYAEQFRYLVDRLAAHPEPSGGGSMLDHTLVVWAKEMGDSRLHECRSVPFVLAGGAGGRLATGRSLRFDGDAHTRLLVSICHAMGLDNPTFGDPARGTGALAGLLS